MFYYPLVNNQFSRRQICKPYQNIKGIVVSTMVFGIQCNFLIVLPILLVFCKSNVFLFCRCQTLICYKLVVL